MRRRAGHLPDCRGRIQDSFDRMLARYYGIPMPRKRLVQTSANPPSRTQMPAAEAENKAPP